MVDTYNVAEWIVERHRLEEEATTLRHRLNSARELLGEESEKIRHLHIEISNTDGAPGLWWTRLKNIHFRLRTWLAEDGEE